ncbi:MAG: tetratricopeptide repeat protein [Chloroflexota bacterium]
MVTGNRRKYMEALKLGADLAWESEWEQAIEHLKVARDEFPDNPKPYTRLGQAYDELGQLEDALENYVHVTRLNPKDVIALGRIADIQERMNEPAQAARTLMAIAELCVARKDELGALAYWEKAAQLEPMLLGARQRLALAYHRQDRLEDSIAERLALAHIYQKQGNTRQAASICKAALELDPDNEAVLGAIASLKAGVDLAIIETATKVERAAEVEVGLDIAEEPVAAELGDLSDFTGSPADEAGQTALADLADLVFDDTVDDESISVQRDAMIGRALECQASGEYDEAISAYKKVVESGYGNPAIHFSLGLLLKERLQFLEATEHFEQAANDPEYSLGARFALGECFRARGRHKEAAINFLEVARIVDMQTVGRDEVDDLVRLYENLANSHIMLGQEDQAAEFSDKLVEFLGTRGWEDKVRDARDRLDSISVLGHSATLAEILTAPESDELVKSISLCDEYARRGYLESAVEECLRAISLAPTFLPTHVRLAQLLQQRGIVTSAASKHKAIADTYLQRGDINRAIDAYESAVELEPFEISRRQMLIDLLKTHGEIGRALEHTLTIAENHASLGQLKRARDQYESVIALSNRADSASVSETAIMKKIADIDTQQLNWRGAVSNYSRIIEIDPDDNETRRRLIELQMRIGNSDTAEAEMDQYLQRMSVVEDSETILETLTSFVEQWPESEHFRKRLASTYAYIGDKQNAVAHLDQMADNQLNADRKEDAIATIETILSLDPDNADQYHEMLDKLKDVS